MNTKNASFLILDLCRISFVLLQDMEYKWTMWL